MTELTPMASTLGGALIGLSAALLLLVQGRVAGISGIVGGLMDRPGAGDVTWRVVFCSGLLLGGLCLGLVRPAAFGFALDRSPAALATAGLLVGVGARLGSGCTSGHGVCGISRMSRRSLAATGVFMLAGATSVWVVRHLLGGAL